MVHCREVLPQRILFPPLGLAGMNVDPLGSDLQTGVGMVTQVERPGGWSPGAVVGGDDDE